MRSMTGYGKGVAQSPERQVTVELKSVNNRYLDISMRTGKGMAFLDDIIRKAIQSRIARGSVEVYFQYENRTENAKVVCADMQLAAQYYKAAKKIRTEFLLDDDFGTTALMRSPDVLKIDVPPDDAEAVTTLTVEAVNKALDSLNVMRQTEGKSIKKDLTVLINNIIELLEKAVKRAPQIVSENTKRLRERIGEILGDAVVDEVRLLNEAAFFADKSDINEEISRLSSHISQFIALLEDNAPQGRKLEFLSQEMNREINTMGSKSNDIELTGFVVAMKNELEKIKEQIRNVE